MRLLTERGRWLGDKRRGKVWIRLMNKNFPNNEDQIVERDNRLYWRILKSGRLKYLETVTDWQEELIRKLVEKEK